MKQYSVIPARIALLRAKNNYSQKQFADQISELLGGDKAITASIVSMWETGRRKMSYKYMGPVSTLFSVTPEYLLGLTDDETSNTASEDSEEVKRIEIPRKHLFKHDGEPVYVEFIDFSRENGWGIYDRQKEQIVFKDFVLKLAGLALKIKIYMLKPGYSTEFVSEGKKNLDMIKVLNLEKVYIKINSMDKGIRNKYDGWYHHNENHTALINSIGLVLPYEGLNISYSAFSMGDADPNMRK